MTSIPPREPREHNEAFLAFVRRLACCACKAHPPSQAAHIRMACPERGKRGTGMGEKPHDRWAVPLCADCHLDGAHAQHRVGEQRFWARANVDPFAVAAKLYAAFSALRPADKLDTEGEGRPRKRVVKRKIKAASSNGKTTPFDGVNVGSIPAAASRLAKPAAKNNRKYNWPSRPMRGAGFPKRG